MSFRSSGTSSTTRALMFAFALFALIAVTAISAASAQAAVGANYTQVSAGNGFGCGVLSVGNIECWGSNSDGQLGDGTRVDRNAPTDVLVGPGATQVSAGASGACAVVSGAAWCWGAGYNGQLGIPNPPGIGHPHIVSGMDSGVTSIAAGGTMNCAVVNGAAKCWGQGYLGVDGGYVQSNTPVQVSGLETGVQSISVSEQGTACAIDADSNVKCWGDGSSGQLGGPGSANTPVLITGLTDVTQIDVGNSFVCAIKGPGGAAVCWGQGYYGALGSGLFNSSNTPVDVVGLDSGVTSISAGENFACAVHAGSAKCWGINDRLQLGSSTAGEKENSPVQVTNLAEDAIVIAAGSRFACASWGGELTCWGSNGSGQLASGTSASSPSPTPTTGLTTGVTDVSAGDSHSCAVVDGAAKCWGSNDYGQLGTGDTVSRQTPTQVDGLTSGVTSISTGSSVTCAVASGEAYCWGSSGNGALGAGYQNSFHSPHLVTGLTSGVTKIVVSDYNACAIVNGGAKCWGFGGYGQLGDGSTNSSDVPVDVDGLQSGVTDIDIAYVHACAVVDGAAKCWGSGGQGSLGLGTWTNTSTPSPAQVPGFESDVTAIGVGDNYSCLLKQGAVFCTGVNYNGQLGTGDQTYHNSFTPVLGMDSGVSQIHIGESSSCALGGYPARCWGLNSGGETGTGLADEYLTVPAAVSPAFSSVEKISIGRGHGCAIDTGAVKCWGNGVDGQLGNGLAFTWIRQIAVPPSDTAGPLLSITSPETDTTITNAETPIEFSVTDNSGTVASIECSSDGVTYADCVSPWAPAIEEGANTFFVRATDGIGNSTTKSLSLALDTQPPSIDIYSPSYTDTGEMSHMLYFNVSDSSSVETLECKVDAGEYASCEASYYTNVTFTTEGTHTVTIKAVDTHGFVGTSVKTFRIDQTAPVVNVTSGATSTSKSPEISFSVDDANAVTTTCEIPSYYYYDNCSSPWTIPYSLPEGDFSFKINATDAAGNVGSTNFTITVDSEAPPVTIDSPGEGDYLTDTTPDIAFSVDNTAGDLDTTKCSLDGGTYADCTSPYTTTTLSDGAHSVSVQTKDTLGNASTAERNFVVDTTGPAVVIDSPSADDILDIDDVNFYFYIDDDSGDLATYDCSLDGTATADCNDGSHFEVDVANGEHTFSVLATDVRGNTSTASVDFVVDTVNPTVDITTGSGSVFTTRSPQISFNAADAGSGIDTIECAVDYDEPSDCTSPFTPQSLSDGWHNVSVTVTDKAGYVASDDDYYFVDATAPGVTITSPTNGSSSTNHTPSIEFVVPDTDSDVNQVECKIDAGEFVDCASPHAAGTLADGVHVAMVKVTDIYGNSTTDSVGFTITTPVIAPPVITPPAPEALPVLGKLPATAKYARAIIVPIRCVTSCQLKLSLKIGTKKYKVPTVKVASGAASGKIKFSKKMIATIKAAAKKKRKSVLTVTPVGPSGAGVPKKIKLK